MGTKQESAKTIILIAQTPLYFYSIVKILPSVVLDIEAINSLEVAHHNDILVLPVAEGTLSAATMIEFVLWNLFDYKV